MDSVIHLSKNRGLNANMRIEKNSCLPNIRRTHLCIPLCQTGEYIFSIKRLGLDVHHFICLVKLNARL